MRKYELIVVGGGFSGVAAALAASRQGIKTLLVEKSNCLGGTATNGLVLPFMPNETIINGKMTSLSGGIFKEIHSELEKRNALHYESFLEEELKLILNRMALDSGVDILYHASLCDVDRAGARINSISVLTIEGIIVLEAEYFIDATGNAQLAYLADLPFTLGREGDNLCQPMTLSFRVGGVDEKAFFEHLDNLNKNYKSYQKEGKIKNPRENILVFKTPINGILHFNSTRIVKKNPTNTMDLTLAELEAREQVYELYEFMREHGKGLENSYILSTGTEIGVRESRKIAGEYTLTEKECVECTKFDDFIAFCNYDIDIHNPEGTGTSHHYFGEGEYYSIPYRTLIPKDTDNILVVGRCISCDHGAQASLRIMPVVTSIGEAGGIAVSLAKQNNKATKEIDIKKLQAILKKNGLSV
ncbi:MAG: FAD-dependent oxidoreductase [Clostridia bacterium]|nr:FAD-dependent oxidoreductase [Clostridia bacterium]